MHPVDTHAVRGTSDHLPAHGCADLHTGAEREPVEPPAGVVRLGRPTRYVPR